MMFVHDISCTNNINIPRKDFKALDDFFGTLKLGPVRVQ